MLNPAEYTRHFDEMPYILAVANETMGLDSPSRGDRSMSPTDLIDRAEAAIMKYPIHAYETGFVALLILADWLISDQSGRHLLREQFQRIGWLIQEVEHAGH